MIKMMCRCGDINVLMCGCCQQAFAVKLTGFSSSKTSYNYLYASEIDRKLFGHFLLDVFVGKSGQESRVWFILFLVAMSFTIHIGYSGCL